MSSDVVSATCTTSDYEEARNDIFDEVFSTQGSSAFHTYWNGFRSFLIGQLSKEEFDVIVTNSLSEEKGEQDLHLCDATLAQSCTSLLTNFLFAISLNDQSIFIIDL